MGLAGVIASCQPLPELGPALSARNILDSDGYGLRLPDQDDKLLAPRDACIDQFRCSMA